MSTMDQDTRYLFTYIELFSAIVAKVEPSAFIIGLDEIAALKLILFFLDSLKCLLSLFLESDLGLSALSVTIGKPVGPGFDRCRWVLLLAIDLRIRLHYYKFKCSNLKLIN
jgi:hypothetical protein